MMAILGGLVGAFAAALFSRGAGRGASLGLVLFMWVVVSVFTVLTALVAPAVRAGIDPEAVWLFEALGSSGGQFWLGSTAVVLLSAPFILLKTPR